MLRPTMLGSLTSLEKVFIFVVERAEATSVFKKQAAWRS